MAKLSDLPIGAKVRDASTKFNGNIITWIIADKNHRGYPSNSVTLISEKVLDKRRFDVGPWYENFKDSEIAKWLNNDSGFLANFSEGFKNGILSTSYDSGTGYSTFDDFTNLKIFLIGYTESGLKSRSTYNQYPFPLFINNRSRIAYDLQKNTPSYEGLKWFTRSGGSGNVAIIGVDGDRGGGVRVTESHGVRPLCNIKSSTQVSDSKDSDGAYTIIWNQPPIIESTTSTNMGTKSNGFSFTYKVTEKDAGQVITVEEYMDNIRTKRFTAQSGSTYTFSLSRPAYQKILNGNHSIKIVVSDDKGGVAEKVFNFSKNETKILVTLDTPLTADAMVTKALINVLGSIPSKAIFKVEACNNAYDSNPTWEDCTEKVLNSRKIFFRNNTKTASKWGFNVRVSLDRNGAAGECYISSIGGNFE